MTTLEELRDRVRAFGRARDWERYHSPRNLAMALSVEAGELLELFLWTADDAPQPSPDRAGAVADEAADVMICLLNLCDRAKIDLGDAVIRKLAAAEVKYPADRVRGRAQKYDQYPEWVRHHLTDREPPAGLPAEAGWFLAQDGLPADLRLAGWAGPTLFTSAMATGSLPQVEGGWVLGTIRETQGADAEYAQFVARAPQGDVVLIEAPDGAVQRAGSTVPTFVRAIEAFHQGFAGLPQPPSPNDVLQLLDQVRRIDPAVVDDPDSYWTRWVDELVR
ncbi:MAG: SUKH-4 family immunity protein [Myxococcota bacterium]